MISRTLFGPRTVIKFSFCACFSQRLCSRSFGGGKMNRRIEGIDDPLKKMWAGSDSNSFLDDTPILSEYEANRNQNFTGRQQFLENVRVNARKVLEVLQQDGPGVDTKSSLSELQLNISGLLVRDVLLGIFRGIDDGNKSRCAKLGYKFFVWCGTQERYQHTANAYHLMMKILAACEEFKAMWRLVDEMIEKGFPTTARTFNILICACGEAGLARVVVERFIKSKTFNFRPFKHSYNAILHCLIALNQYKLVEWVYQQMLADGYSPDLLTYNVVMCAKYRLGKLDQFHRLLDEMSRRGFSPDIHTYNILLHVLGKGDKPLAALNLLNHMKEEGLDPSVLHFTTLLDGLSRAGNLDACKYFFDEMIKNGCIPDVVCYTVMITGYVVAGELEKAKELFDGMVIQGKVPNVFTYNSMIRGFCMAGQFAEACSMLEEMESRGCIPNFLVYSTLVSYLRNAGKLGQARDIIRRMVDKGRYINLVPKFKGYRDVNVIYWKNFTTVLINGLQLILCTVRSKESKMLISLAPEKLGAEVQ